MNPEDTETTEDLLNQAQAQDYIDTSAAFQSVTSGDSGHWEIEEWGKPDIAVDFEFKAWPCSFNESNACWNGNRGVLRDVTPRPSPVFSRSGVCDRI
jgi:hypothetical protein